MDSGLEDYLSMILGGFFLIIIGTAVLFYILILICSPCWCFLCLWKLWKLCRRRQQQRHQQVLPQKDKQDDDCLKTVSVEHPVPTPPVIVPVSTDIPTRPEFVNRGKIYSTRQEAYDAAKRDGGGREPLLHPPHSLLGWHHYHVHGHEIINGVNMHYKFIP